MPKLKLAETPHSGMLITFCGLDGCGKSTIIRDLTEYLNQEYGIRPELTKQPTDSVRKSEIFRTYMDCPDHNGYDYRSLSLLAASDRLQHSNKVIKPMLQSGETVISDRYFYSCLANLRARGFQDDTWIYEVARFIPRPDLAFFLDVPVKTAVQRVRERPEEKDRYVDIELQFRLRQEYLDIAKNNGGIVVSTNQPYLNSFSEVKKQVELLIAEKSKNSILFSSKH